MEAEDSDFLEFYASIGSHRHLRKANRPTPFHAKSFAGMISERTASRVITRVTFGFIFAIRRFSQIQQVNQTLVNLMMICRPLTVTGCIAGSLICEISDYIL